MERVELFEILRLQQAAILGLQRQIESLVRVDENVWNALLLLAGESPRPEVEELSQQARAEIEELRKLYERPGEEPGEAARE